MSEPPAVAGGSSSLRTRPLPQAVLTQLTTCLGGDAVQLSAVSLEQVANQCTAGCQPAVHPNETRSKLSGDPRLKLKALIAGCSDAGLERLAEQRTRWLWWEPGVFSAFLCPPKKFCLALDITT